ncbi:hypothetical protein [Nocardia vaccinii]|uniref:hypothetical protein n=1 Tax=Nocardia vaccinii TaxID=1822 RepID=UPI000A7EC525|nr:hypothetical protein [Nocardia vaccinii]
MTGRGHETLWGRIRPAAYSLVLALIVAGPLLGPGYLLLRDGVSTPRSYPTDSALGLGDAAPRAVPQDWLLATVSSVVDGGIVVKAILVGALWAAGWGAAALSRRLLDVSLGPQLLAATVAVWNPYVAERLLQGHWSLLAGYAALPWTVLAAYRIRRGTDERATSTRYSGPNPRSGRESAPEDASKHGRATEPGETSAHPRAVTPNRAGTRPEMSEPIRAGANRRGPAIRMWLGLGGCLAAAGLTPTGALLAGCAALVVVGRRKLVGTLALWCVASAPWLVAAALSGTGAEPSDPAGITAFAARAEPGLGTIGSLAGLGGIWNAQAVPGSRTTLFALVGTVVLLLIVAAGVRRVAAPGDAATRYVRRALLILAGAAILFPALGATGWGLQLGQFLVTRIPGAGLLRDTQKYVALAMPAFALCAAASCREIAAGFRSAPAEQAADDVARRTETAEPTGGGGGGTGWVAAVCIALLIAVLPDLAWGVGGAMRAVRYPAGWQAVAERMDGPGDVAVLPGGMFREFPYSGRVPVLDPAPRMLPRDVLQTGELPVRGGSVAGEGMRARVVERLLLDGASPAELAAHGVGWVLVEHTSPGPLGRSRATLDRLTAGYADHELSLYQVPHPHDMAAKSPGAHRFIAIAAHLAWALLLLAGALAAACDRWPIRLPGRAERPDR